MSRSWVIGLEKVIFSIWVAIALASKIPIQIGMAFFSSRSLRMTIGVLVIGGFFQIQILQKVAQIGVLKAIGAPNFLVGLASVIQIVMVTTIGVAIGGLGVFLLSLGFPPTIPIVFNGQSTALAVIALLLIGPIGGLVSIRYAVRIEPLRALGLGG